MTRKDIFISSPETLNARQDFQDSSELRAANIIRKEFGPGEFYPRDGTIKLGEIEARSAYFAGVEPAELVALGSGMAAIDTAVQVALQNAPEDELAVVAHARGLYIQSAILLNSQRHVKTVTFDSGDSTSVENVIEKHAPEVIFAETVGNGSEVPVLDVPFLFDSIRRHSPESTLILDNTLPLATACPVAEILDEDSNILVVESGTKAYTFNKELAGWIYSKNPELINQVRAFRRMKGNGPGVATQERTLELLADTREEFDARNLKLYENAGSLALALAEVQEDTGFVVAHPSLASHPNYEYAKKHFPRGLAPLLFLNGDFTADHYQFADDLRSHPTVQEHTRMVQSFGWDDTSILPYEGAPMIRISPGANTDAEVLGTAFQQAVKQHVINK